jgi:protease-4
MATKKLQASQIVIVLSLILILVGIGILIFKTQTGEGDFTKPAIAVIPISGAISLEGDGASAQEIVKIIKKADKDPTVKAIILDINSPGGTVVASEEIAAAVKGAKKPVVAWIREIGASGAYWIASASDTIVADPASITGSIGVSGSYLQFSGLMDKYGVTYERLVTGTFKDTGSEYKELTDEERAYLMSKLNAINSVFIDAVSANRNLDRTYVATLATGEIFLGSEAADKGLVDVLGGKNEAQLVAQQLAGISSSRLVTMQEQKGTLLDLISSSSQAMAYWIGRGIGDSWNPLTSSEEDFVLMAQMP